LSSPIGVNVAAVVALLNAGAEGLLRGSGVLAPSTPRIRICQPAGSGPVCACPNELEYDGVGDPCVFGYRL